MNISGSFGEIDKVRGSQPCESSVDSIEKIVSRDIVCGLYPLAFEHSPESLRNVEMRGIRRQEEKIKAPFLPDFSHFLHILAPVHLGIVKHDECVLPYCKGEPVKEIRDAFGCHAFGGTEAVIAAVIVNHSPDVEPCAPVRRNGDVLSGKLPAVWHVSFGTSEAPVSKIEVDKALLSVKEVCAYLGIGETKARELLTKTNNNFTVLIGNRVYANKIQLDKWIAHNSGNKVEKKGTTHRRIKREESSMEMQMTM